MEEPFRQNALSGIVRIHLARALEGVRSGLNALNSLKKTVDKSTALMLPGNDEAMTCDAEKELLGLKRGIEKLLPQSKRIEFGLENLP